MGNLRAIGCFILSLALWPLMAIGVAIGLAVFIVAWPIIGTKTMSEELR